MWLYKGNVRCPHGDGIVLCLVGIRINILVVMFCKMLTLKELGKLYNGSLLFITTVCGSTITSK